ncbi:uncharacterized protein LOC106643650 [Copidosoma floridanum]|uniref:uncharacterized protein LOC106643650 n=1 Tax=Copidosoma floridanum TaxID=29053 RepID=UPI0006C9D17A|nr:uncharacterized protein LOC106643650 [Copidosoma floridanum]
MNQNPVFLTSIAMSTAEVSEHASNSNDETDIEIKMEVPERCEEEFTFQSVKGIQPQVIIHDPTFGIWTSEAESCLIKLYKKYKPMIGQHTRFKSFRDMFDTISAEMKKYGFFFSPQKCENKWRVMERKYKTLALREKLKKPGRIKHYGRWQHKKVFDEIYSEENKNIYLEKDAATEQSLNVSAPKVDAFFDSMPTENGQTSLTDIVKTQTNAILSEVRKIFNDAENNRERRHLEQMILFKNLLNVQERLLKIEEQKLTLRKASVAVMSQSMKHFT